MTRTTSVTTEVTPSSQAPSNATFPSSSARTEFLEENRPTGNAPTDKKDQKPESLTKESVEAALSGAGMTVTNVTSRGRSDTVEYKDKDGALFGKVEITVDDKDAAAKASAEILKQIDAKKVEGEANLRVVPGSITVNIKGDFYKTSGRITIPPSELGNLSTEQVNKLLERAVPPLTKSEIQKPFEDLGASVTNLGLAANAYEIKFSGGNIGSSRARIAMSGKTPETVKGLDELLKQVDPTVQGTHSYDIQARDNEIVIGIKRTDQKLSRATIKLDANGAITPEAMAAGVEKLTGVKPETKPTEKPSTTSPTPGTQTPGTQTPGTQTPGTQTPTTQTKPAETKPDETKPQTPEKPSAPATNPLPETLKLNNDRASLAVSQVSSVKVLDKEPKDNVSIIENKHGKTYAVISRGEGTEVKTSIVEVDLKNASFNPAKLKGTTYTDKDGVAGAGKAVKTEGEVDVTEETRKQLAEAFKAARVLKGLDKEEPAQKPAAEKPKGEKPTEKPTEKPMEKPSTEKPATKPATTLDGSKLKVDDKITAEEQALFRTAMQTPAFVEFMKAHKDVTSVNVSSAGAAIVMKDKTTVGFDSKGALIEVIHKGEGDNLVEGPMKGQAVKQIQKTLEELIAEFNAKPKK